MINVAYVRQGEPLGLGHAVLVARELVGDEPFAVILADDVIDAKPPALKQMIDVFEKVGGPVLAVERVPRTRSRTTASSTSTLGRSARRLPGAGPGRKAAARRGPVESRHHRALPPDARYFSRPRAKPRATGPAKSS